MNPWPGFRRSIYLTLWLASCSDAGSGAVDETPDSSVDEPEPADAGTMEYPTCRRPHGIYKSTFSIASGPCLDPEDGTGPWIETSVYKRFNGCDISPDRYDPSGCTSTASLSCDDGSSIESSCQIDANASSITCESVNNNVTSTCVVRSRLQRLGPVTECWGLLGLYQTWFEQIGGDPACGTVGSMYMDATQIAALIGPGNCTENTGTTAPEADTGLCTIEASNMCGEAKTITCVGDPTGAVVDCGLDLDGCVYSLHLVR